jgi:hypothetical protein
VDFTLCDRLGEEIGMPKYYLLLLSLLGGCDGLWQGLRQPVAENCVANPAACGPAEVCNLTTEVCEPARAADSDLGDGELPGKKRDSDVNDGSDKSSREQWQLLDAYVKVNLSLRYGNATRYQPGQIGYAFLNARSGRLGGYVWSSVGRWFANKFTKNHGL